MKRLTFFIMGILLLPAIAQAAPLSLLNDSASFVLARSIKLGNSDDISVKDKTIGHKCSSGEYMTTNGCKACSTALTGCSTCINADTCTKCESGYLRTSDNKCVVSACKSDNDCEVDQTCKNPGKVTATCENINCTGTQYADKHTCKNCSTVLPGCVKCDSAKACSVCDTGYVLNADGTCDKLSCSADEYLSVDECLPCKNALTACTQCNDSKTCTKCESGHSLVNGKCVSVSCSSNEDCASDELCFNAGTSEAYCERVTCSERQYMENRVCFDCSTNCVQCSNDKACTKCDTGYVLNGSKACEPAICETGSYLSGTDCLKCADALSKCIACDNATTCTTCEAGYAVVNGKCVKAACTTDSDCTAAQKCSNPGQPNAACDSVVCSAGQYVSNHACAACSTGCVECSNASSCSKCSASYVLNNGKCDPLACSSNNDCAGNEVCVNPGKANAYCEKVTCSKGQYLSGRTCVNCSANCAACTGANACTECTSADYKLSGGACTKKTCSEINSSYTTACSEGYTSALTGKAGSDGTCVTCTAKPCSAAGYSSSYYKDLGTTRPSCTTQSEWYVKTFGKSGDATCYACVCDGTSFGGGGCCSGGKVTCGGTEGPCRECCNNNTNTCGSGKKCDNYKCTVCPAGEKCYCPGTQVSDGKGGCEEKAECSSYKDCPAGYACWSGKCSACSAGSNINKMCNCPSGSTSTGSGSCSVECKYSTAAACKSGINNCSTCSANSDGCYVCSACASGFTMGSNGTVCSSSGSGGSTGWTCPTAPTATYNKPTNCSPGYGWKGIQDCTCVVSPQGSNWNNYSNCPTNAKSSGVGSCTTARCSDANCWSYNGNCKESSFTRSYQNGSGTVYQICYGNGHGGYDQSCYYCYK